MSKYIVLYNPMACSNHGKEKAEELNALLKGDELVFQSITRIEDYSAWLHEIGPDVPVILVGGDGTINHFANHLSGHDVPNDILLYAAGTGNDFLADVGKKESPVGPLFPLKKYLCDLPTVTINGQSRLFVNGVGYGIDGYCCEVGDELRKQSDKPVNYAGIAIKGLLFHYKPTNAVVTVDGKKHEFKKVWLAPVMHGKCYGGGMIPTPDQDRLNPEHTLSVLIWHGSGKIATLAAFPGIFKGEHIKHKKNITILTGHEITVKFDRPVAAQIDGETVLNVSEVSAKSV